MQSQHIVSLLKKIGWFIGWMEKGKRRLVFAYYTELDYQPSPVETIPTRQFATEELLKI